MFVSLSFSCFETSLSFLNFFSFTLGPFFLRPSDWSYSPLAWIQCLNIHLNRINTRAAWPACILHLFAALSLQSIDCFYRTWLSPASTLSPALYIALYPITLLRSLKKQFPIHTKTLSCYRGDNPLFSLSRETLPSFQRHNTNKQRFIYLEIPVDLLPSSFSNPFEPFQYQALRSAYPIFRPLIDFLQFQELTPGLVTANIISTPVIHYSCTNCHTTIIDSSLPLPAGGARNDSF